MPEACAPSVVTTWPPHSSMYSRCRHSGGLSEARPRSGVFVATGARTLPAAADRTLGPPPAGALPPDWPQRVRRSLAGRAHPEQAAAALAQTPYPFIYGTHDPELFPTDDFRECCVRTLTRSQLPQVDARLRRRRPARADRADPPARAAQARRVRAARGDPRHRGRAAGLPPAGRALLDASHHAGHSKSRATRTRATPSRCAAAGGCRCRWTTGPGGHRPAGRCSTCSSRPSHQSPTTVHAEPGAPPGAAAAGPGARLRDHRRRLRGRVPARRRADAGAEEPGPQRARDLHRLAVQEPVAGAAAGLHRGAACAGGRAARLRHAMVRHPSAFLQQAYALFLSLGHHESHARRVNQAMQERMPLGRPGACAAPAGLPVHAAAGRRLAVGAVHRRVDAASWRAWHAPTAC
jgi:GntR family transcriptional regulator / MocR family aminotransferase